MRTFEGVWRGTFIEFNEVMEVPASAYYPPPSTLVTVLIPCYNHGRTLERAVVSALRQVPMPEVLVINDGSTDETQDVIERLGVRSFTTENRGLSHALNLGLSQARGEWIQRLDADDELAAGWLRSAELHLMDDDVDLVYGQLAGLWEVPRWSREALVVRNIIPYAALFRTARARDLGGFRAGLEQTLGVQDWGLWLTMLLTNDLEVRQLAVPHLLYHADQGNRMSTGGFTADPALVAQWLRQRLAELSED